MADQAYDQMTRNPEEYDGPPELAPQKVLTKEEIEQRKSIETDESKNFYVLISGSKIVKSEEQINLVNTLLDDVFANHVLNDNIKNIIIVEGAEEGIDTVAKSYGESHNYIVKPFIAEWAIYGGEAGLIRNEKMHEFIATKPNRLCICFKDSKSHGTGTQHSADLAKKFQTNTIFFNLDGLNYTKAEYLGRKSRIYKKKDYYGIL